MRFGGSTAIWVPDNLKSGITTPNRYEPDVNRTYVEIAQHYGAAVIPVRSRAPKDKVKVDTEVRKLDELRASHINQQHNVRWQIKALPEQIERARKYHAAVTADIHTRDEHADEDFTMTVGNRVYAGKGAREEAGNALNSVVMSWREDKTPQVRARFKGFEILSRGSVRQDSESELLIRGKATYKANLNPENALGTIASIEHTLRGIDAKAEDERHEIERHEKALAGYQAQLGCPFEHEARLKELLAQQAQLKASLDLDKHDAQTVDEPRESEEKAAPVSFAAPIRAQDRDTAMAP